MHTPNQGNIMTNTHTNQADNLAFDFMAYARTHGFGEVHIKIDHQSGMIAIIALHSTKYGPALGGCRFIEYANTDAAIQDAMRLAIGMSSKTALANLPLGGGKAVIMKPKETYDRDAYLKAFGEFVDSLGGRYITALDSGTQLSDMDIIAKYTPFVASRSSHGDPSPSTAEGVLRGIEAAVLFKHKIPSLRGLHVAVQGLGHVGYRLAELLHIAGAKLTVADVNTAIVEHAINAFDAQAVSADDIHAISCDVFAPCALGGILNDMTIPKIQANIVAGAANNQLEHTYHGQQLHERSILYAPDYVINSGGVIFAASQYLASSKEQMHLQINGIGNRLLEIFERSVAENQPTNAISDTIARTLLS
jgi:leucine dehydrogenase